MINSIILFLLFLGLVICFVVVIVTNRKIYKFLEDHVGFSMAEDGSVNQEIRKLLDDVSMVKQKMVFQSQIDRLQTDLDLSVNGVQSANQMLHKISEDIQVVKSHTERIDRLQQTSPDVVADSKNDRATILILADEISRQKRENERLTKQISDLTKELEQIH